MHIDELVLEDAGSGGRRAAHQIGAALARLLEQRGVPTSVASTQSVVLETSPNATDAGSRLIAESIAGSIYRGLEESGL